MHVSRDLNRMLSGRKYWGVEEGKKTVSDIVKRNRLGSHEEQF